MRRHDHIGFAVDIWPKKWRLTNADRWTRRRSTPSTAGSRLSWTWTPGRSQFLYGALRFGLVLGFERTCSRSAPPAGHTVNAEGVLPAFTEFFFGAETVVSPWIRHYRVLTESDRRCRYVWIGLSEGPNELFRVDFTEFRTVLGPKPVDVVELMALIGLTSSTKLTAKPDWSASINTYQILCHCARITERSNSIQVASFN